MGELAGRVYIESHVAGRTPFAPGKDSAEAVACHLVHCFEPSVHPEASGLYVASSNAGFQPAVQFWSEAMHAGLAFASPELFPWTLANALCGSLARRFDIMGPNCTYTGGSGALLSALLQAWTDLVLARTAAAWVVAVDFASTPAGATSFAAIRLSSNETACSLEPVAAASPQARSNRPSLYLTQALRRVDQGPGTIVLSAGATAFALTVNRQVSPFQ